MDDLDFSILREMMRGGSLGMEGLVPWVTPDAIARRVGAGRSTVQARLSAWRKRGFVRGYTTMPNPSLFGAIGFGQTVRVDDPRLRAGFFERLESMDGLAIAVESVGAWIAIVHTDQSAAAIRRRAKEIAALPGVAESEPLITSRAPAARVEPTAQDWRIMRELRERPEASMKELAERLSVSTKTIQRRLTRLVEGDALFFQLSLDFSRAEGAFVDLIVTLEDPRHRERTVAALRKLFPRLLERNRASGPDAPVAQVTLHFDAVGQVEDAVRVAAALAGVRDVEPVFPIRIRELPRWTDKQIAEALAKAEARGPNSAPPLMPLTRRTL